MHWSTSYRNRNTNMSIDDFFGEKYDVLLTRCYTAKCLFLSILGSLSRFLMFLTIFVNQSIFSSGKKCATHPTNLNWMDGLTCCCRAHKTEICCESWRWTWAIAFRLHKPPLRVAQQMLTADTGDVFIFHYRFNAALGTDFKNAQHKSMPIEQSASRHECLFKLGKKRPIVHLKKSITSTGDTKISENVRGAPQG